jgi:hypothetical protein
MDVMLFDGSSMALDWKQATARSLAVAQTESSRRAVNRESPAITGRPAPLIPKMT